MGVTMAVAQSLEEVESLSEGLVCEYLKRRGLTKTLETFNMEISEEKRDEDDLSSQFWLELRQRLRVNEFIRNNAALIVNGQPPTTLEILLHLSNNSFKDEAQRGLVPDFAYRSTTHQN